MDLTLVSLVLAILIALYFYSTKNFKYWKKRKIPYVDRPLPAIGHSWKFISMQNTYPELCTKIYKAFQKHSMVGFYNFTKPTLIVLEPELVKTVMQSDFTSFHENSFPIDPTMEPLLAYNPFFTYGDRWMTARKRITYAFSNVRLKILLESVKTVCEKFQWYVNKKIGNGGKAELELKDLFSRFTAQVVAGAGFGVDGLCFDDEKEEDSFYAIGKTSLNPDVITNLIFMFIFFVPHLNKIIKMNFIPPKTDKFFKMVVADVVEQRKKDGIVRNDFIQLMLDLAKTEGKEIDMDVLTSHVSSFFFDGYETSSSVLSFVGFNLAKYPDVQKRLRDEVIAVLKKYNGAITYDALKEMTYMDQVISESQRITPTIGLLSKQCTEDCELRGSDGLVCRVERGTPIVIPVEALQKDPRYWKNAETFDPDRFGPERKQNNERYAFLPFGEGPRMCVGMRMALLQIKACLATLLKNYSLELSPRTKLPLEFVSATFLLAAKGGIWVYIRPL